MIFCSTHRLVSNPVVIREASSRNWWKQAQRPTDLDIFFLPLRHNYILAKCHFLTSNIKLRIFNTLQFRKVGIWENSFDYDVWVLSVLDVSQKKHTSLLMQILVRTNHDYKTHFSACFRLFEEIISSVFVMSTSCLTSYRSIF